MLYNDHSYGNRELACLNVNTNLGGCVGADARDVVKSHLMVMTEVCGKTIIGNMLFVRGGVSCFWLVLPVS